MKTRRTDQRVNDPTENSLRIRIQSGERELCGTPGPVEIPVTICLLTRMALTTRTAVNPESGKGYEHAHEDDEMIALFVADDGLPVNDAGQAVVITEPFSSDACLSYDV